MSLEAAYFLGLPRPLPAGAGLAWALMVGCLSSLQLPTVWGWQLQCRVAGGRCSASEVEGKGGHGPGGKLSLLFPPPRKPSQLPFSLPCTRPAGASGILMGLCQTVDCAGDAPCLWRRASALLCQPPLAGPPAYSLAQQPALVLPHLCGPNDLNRVGSSQRRHCWSAWALPC